MTRRLDLDPLDRALDYIEQNPHLWYQDLWISETDCGTVGCLFGWAALLAGGTPTPSSFGDRLMADATEPGAVAADNWVGWKVSVVQRVINLTGLTRREAEQLSDSYNTLDDLREQLARLHRQARAEEVGL